MPGGTVGFWFDQIGAAVPKLADHSRTVMLDPAIGTCKGMLQAFEMSLPNADLEIKTLLPIAAGLADH